LFSGISGDCPAYEYAHSENKDGLFRVDMSDFHRFSFIAKPFSKPSKYAPAAVQSIY
jgi:hypothetical protein